MGNCCFCSFDRRKATVFAVILKPSGKIVWQNNARIAPYPMQSFLKETRLNIVMPNSTPPYFATFTNKEISFL